MTDSVARGALMVCGTSSDVGKSHVVIGLCRALARRGVRVAPFKGQNMALNSVVTAMGAEIGRAQYVQALAARAEPEAAMNPVLLKPTGDRSSQVVVMGRPWQTLGALEYHAAKATLFDTVLGALGDLRSRFDVVLCEGAGSPAEINLMARDLVNLGVARAAGIPAIVVGDIDRGGVFAHLHGTVDLLPSDLRALVRGFVINKFRGDPALLGEATSILEARTGVPTLGVLEYLSGVDLDAEDSLSMSATKWHDSESDAGPPHDGEVLDVAVIRFPHIANFTDLDPLRIEPGVVIHYVEHASELDRADLVILPGTKTTTADLEWFRARGFDRALDRLRGRTRAPVVLGICGGYQMLGREIHDPAGVEGVEPKVDGLGRLGLVTRFEEEKVTRRTRGRITGGHGLPVGGEVGVEGYEIHHGLPMIDDGAVPWFEIVDEACSGDTSEGVVDPTSGVFGTSLHGVFEFDGFRRYFLREVAGRAGKDWRSGSVRFADARDRQIDRLADACESSLDLDRLCAIAGEAVIP